MRTSWLTLRKKVVALERKKESDSVEKIAALKATIEELKKK